MRRTTALVLFALLALTGLAFAQDTEKTIVALEQKWLDAQLANNTALSAPLFADTAVFTSVEGKLSDKAAFLAADGKTKYAGASLEEMKVTVYGDTAIASYVFKAKGTGSSGKPFDLTERATDTWVKMKNGEWQLVAAHGSAMK